MNFITKNLSNFVIITVTISIIIVNTVTQPYEKGNKIIVWDVISYYAYLPATFIYEDISLSFWDTDVQKYKKIFWPITTPTGKYGIMTTMGMSFLYSPFFFVAHLYALNSDYEADGFSKPYRFLLSYSMLFYFIVGLFFLKKILNFFFKEQTTAITLLLVAVGTNLYFYTTASATPMPHSYNFALITLFTWLVIKWDSKPSNKLAIGLGLLTGLIILIRPTNILIILILLFWNITSFNDFKKRIKFYFTSHYILLMIFFAFLIWIPQLIYWKYISGQFFYFSYGAKNERFFFNNPQIIDFLFSFRKGWYIYTPIMFIATIGLIPLYRKNKSHVYLILSFLILFIYIMSSWWCWWFGGSFGQRAMIDIYGIMAIPLAAFIEMTRKKRIIFYICLFILVTLTWYNTFQIRQFNKKGLHYDSMSYEAYKETFLRLTPTPKYWELLEIPDYEKARQGIYKNKEK